MRTHSGSSCLCTCSGIQILDHELLTLASLTTLAARFPPLAPLGPLTAAVVSYRLSRVRHLQPADRRLAHPCRLETIGADFSAFPSGQTTGRGPQRALKDPYPAFTHPSLHPCNQPWLGFPQAGSVQTLPWNWLSTSRAAVSDRDNKRSKRTVKVG